MTSPAGLLSVTDCAGVRIFNFNHVCTISDVVAKFAVGTGTGGAEVSCRIGIANKANPVMTPAVALSGDVRIFGRFMGRRELG